MDTDARTADLAHGTVQLSCSSCLSNGYQRRFRRLGEVRAGGTNGVLEGDNADSGVSTEVLCRLQEHTLACSVEDSAERQAGGEERDAPRDKVGKRLSDDARSAVSALSDGAEKEGKDSREGTADGEPKSGCVGRIRRRGRRTRTPSSTTTGAKGGTVMRQRKRSIFMWESDCNLGACRFPKIEAWKKDYNYRA
ncbi:hypothetical protein B0H13DRAFT_1854777 [Mycena leptocephala]|nr:hypothetical protein B0H13DRAFT_1854777 [Mycena leptocephala]